MRSRWTRTVTRPGRCLVGGDLDHRAVGTAFSATATAATAVGTVVPGALLEPPVGLDEDGDADGDGASALADALGGAMDTSVGSGPVPESSLHERAAART